MSITYHLVAGEYYRSTDRTAPYTPESFADEGFIHCTDGIDNVVDVANRYYKSDQRMYVVLVLDTAKIEAEVRYDDEAKIYPHIYGPLNRDAITDILPMLRASDGTFLPPRQ
jgi:uncharacterized protein (DUF952 family)